MVLVKSKRVFDLEGADYHVEVAVLSDSAIEDDSVKLAALVGRLALLRLKEDSAAVTVLNVNN